MKLLNKDQIVINTLVFLEQHQLGIPQSAMIDWVNESECKNIEIRREFIRDFNAELNDIKTKSEQYGISVFYSIPDVLYENHKLKSERFELYCKEAEKMNCHSIKLNIGDFDNVSLEDLKAITEQLEKYSVTLRVENDQTESNGKASKIYHFLSLVKQLGGDISFTFDIGNWLFQNEDPFENAKLLRQFVTYIHIKNLDRSKNTVLLNEGIIDLKNVLNQFSNDVPIAIEYPIISKEQLDSEINNILHLLEVI